MSNEELVSLIQSGIDVQQNMGELYQQNKKFIYSIAHPYIKTLGGSMSREKTTTVLEKDDVMQECYFALQQAVDGYDANKGFLFTTYLAWWVKSKSKRYVLDNNASKRNPEHELILMSKYHKFIREYKLEHQHEPSEKEIRDALGITEKKMHTLVKHIHESNVQSMDAFVPGTESMTISETVADDYDLDSDVLDRVTKQELWDAVDELDDRKRTVVVGRYKNNLTQGDVAKIVGVSLSRIGQIEQKALKALKENQKFQEIAALYGFNCKAMYKWSVERFKNTSTSSTEHLALKHIEMEQWKVNIDDMFNQIMSMV